MIFVIGSGLALMISAVYAAIKVFPISEDAMKKIANLANQRKEMGEDNWKRIIDECTGTIWEANLMLIFCGPIFCLGLNFLFAFVI